VVPLVGILLTLGFTIMSQRKQMAEQIRAAKEASRLAFEIKAAEIAFAGKTPAAVFNRGTALKALFADRLPAGFLDGFEPMSHGGDAEHADGKKLLLEMLVTNAGREKEILAYWTQLFPGDEWIGRLTASTPQNAIEPTSHGGDAGHADGKKLLLEMLVTNAGREKEILAYWTQLFPRDEWVGRLTASTPQNAMRRLRASRRRPRSRSGSFTGRSPHIRKPAPRPGGTRP